VPDIQVLLNGALLPLELKAGRLARDKSRLFIHELEPSQVSWHIRFWRAGGRAIILVGLPGVRSEWEVYELPPVSFDLMNWKKGWLWSETRKWQNWSGS
jgi:hypothetical protein